MAMTDPIWALHHYTALAQDADAAAAWKIQCQTDPATPPGVLAQARADSEAASRTLSQAICLLRRTFPPIDRVWGYGGSTAAQRQTVLDAMRAEAGVPVTPPDPPATALAQPTPPAPAMWQSTLF